MRSNASSVTLPAGCAAAQASGSRVPGGLRLIHELRDAEVEAAVEDGADRLALRDRRPWTGTHEIVPGRGRRDERVRLVHESADGDAHRAASRSVVSCTVRAHGVKFVRAWRRIRFAACAKLGKGTAA